MQNCRPITSLCGPEPASWRRTLNSVQRAGDLSGKPRALRIIDAAQHDGLACRRYNKSRRPMRVFPKLIFRLPQLNNAA